MFLTAILSVGFFLLLIGFNAEYPHGTELVGILGRLLVLLYISVGGLFAGFSLKRLFFN